MEELEMFINNLQNKDSSSITIANYRRNLAKWFDYQEITSLDGLKKVKVYDIKRYDTYLNSKGLSPNTRFSYTMPISSFYNFLIEIGLLENNPYKLTYHLKNVKDIEPFEESDIRAFLKECTKKRDIAMFSLMFETGMRYCEISSITIDSIKNINDDVYCVKVCGKGNKNRELGFSKTTYNFIIDYIKNERPQFLNGKELLFVTKNNKVIRNNELNYSFKRIAKKAKIEMDNFHLHQTRHTFCTTHIEHGFDVKQVQFMMGHSSSETTLKIYTHIKSKSLINKMSNESLIYK